MMTELFVTLSILLAVLFIGTPVSFGLGFVAVSLILIYLSPSQLAQLGSVAFDQATGINLIIAPLFIFMAEILSQSGIAADIFLVMSKWLRRVKGGLAVSATLPVQTLADLIAMATHGHRGLNDLIRGSVASELRHRERPERVALDRRLLVHDVHRGAPWPCCPLAGRSSAGAPATDAIASTIFR